jgi:hypothetical protein
MPANVRVDRLKQVYTAAKVFRLFLGVIKLFNNNGKLLKEN